MSGIEWVSRKVRRRVKEVDPRHQERAARDQLKPKTGQISVANRRLLAAFVGLAPEWSRRAPNQSQISPNLGVGPDFDEVVERKLAQTRFIQIEGPYEAKWVERERDV